MRAPIACFGELLIRLSAPGRHLIEQAQSLDLHVGGAEANVALGLAHLGNACRFVSRLPDNALGRKALAHMRAAGVDCADVLFAKGRMGLYFLTPGAGRRAAEVIYDRRDSAFAAATPDVYDWDVLLDGVELLHLSGVTPALGATLAQITIDAARAARRRGVAVSFDGNFRSSLWQQWPGDPKAVLHELFGLADILFGNHCDLSLVLGRPISGGDKAARRRAAEEGFDAFPRLKLIASTSRTTVSADRFRLSARVATPGDEFEAEEIEIEGGVDRIGAGDAFAAGVLHQWMKENSALASMAQTGLALAALKHSLPGDASLFREADVADFLRGGLDVRR